VDFEKIFFAKSKKYFFERQFEPYGKDQRMAGMRRAREYGYSGKGSYQDWYFNKRKKQGWRDNSDRLLKGFGQGMRGQHRPKLLHPLGRSKRAVWRIPTRPFGEAHFAVYPPELIKTPILAGVRNWCARNAGGRRKRSFEPAMIMDLKPTPPDHEISEILRRLPVKKGGAYWRLIDGSAVIVGRDMSPGSFSIRSWEVAQQRWPPGN